MDQISSGKWKKTKGIEKSIQKLKSEIEEFDDVECIMRSQFWLLVYENEFNNWDMGFSKEYSKDNFFFKRMKELEISFYDKNYEYPQYKYTQEESNSRTNSKYITRKEFEKYREDIKCLIGKITSDETIGTEIQKINDKVGAKIEMINNSYY